MLYASHVHELHPEQPSQVLTIPDIPMRLRTICLHRPKTAAGIAAANEQPVTPFILTSERNSG
jgi:hypothetical protein